MAFTVTAVIVDVHGKPLPVAEARVCVYVFKTNTPRAIGVGRTDSNGNLTISCNFTWTAELQPRLELQLLRAGAYAVASHAPAQFTEAGCDYGKVVFNTAAEADEGPEASITELTGAIADQLRSTQTRLRAERAGIQLGRVSLQLKVLPGAAAERVVLARLPEIQRAGAAGLSLLSVDFVPDGGGARATSGAVPRVTGYTEAMARRKLAEQRLVAEVVFQMVTSDAEAGRVVSQSPAAGAHADEGAAVVIAIGRRG